MKSFDGINESLVEVLKKEGVTSEMCSTRYSDLYVDCKSLTQANKIANGGIWKSMSSVFKSNAEPFGPCVEIGCAYLSGYIESTKGRS